MYKKLARAPITNIDLIASATCDKELFILCKIRNIFIIIIMDTIMDNIMNTIMDTIMDTKLFADLLRA